MSLRICASSGCGRRGVARFTWPGKPLQDACEPCARRARAIADALGFTLQIESTITGQEDDGLSRTSLLEVDDL